MDPTSFFLGLIFPECFFLSSGSVCRGGLVRIKRGFPSLSTQQVSRGGRIPFEESQSFKKKKKNQGKKGNFFWSGVRGAQEGWDSTFSGGKRDLQADLGMFVGSGLISMVSPGILGCLWCWVTLKHPGQGWDGDGPWAG